MSARSPRRSFAAPFVITLAAAPACAPKAPPTTAQPETTSAQTQGPHPEDMPVANPPRPQESTPASEPERSWSLKQVGKQCFTQPEGECEGDACKPTPYECPKWDDGSEMGLATRATIRGAAGGSECTLYQIEDCPRDTDCNPPPPRRVACPKV